MVFYVFLENKNFPSYLVKINFTSISNRGVIPVAPCINEVVAVVGQSSRRRCYSLKVALIKQF